MMDLSKSQIWTKFNTRPFSKVYQNPPQKKILLFLHLYLLVVVATLLRLFIDFFNQEWMVLMADFTFLVIVLITYLLDKKSYHSAANYVFAICMNLALFIYSNMIPKEIGVYLYFFPLILSYFFVFEHQEKGLRIIWSAISACLLITLELSNYQLFGNISIIKEPSFFSYLVNVSTAIFLIFFACTFITQLNHHAEEYLQAQAEKIQEQNKKLAKTNAELDRFVYSASHDLKAPLASIKGLINLFEKEELQPLHYEYLHLMTKCIDHLEGFIADITHHSRNERLEVEPTTVSLAKIFKEAIAGFNFHPGVDKLKTKLDISDDINVITDKHRLLIVLNNLYSNAIKYQRPDRADAYIHISAWVTKSQLYFQVKDNGIGMYEDVKNKIFEMFYRGSETSTGSGLGLYIVKEVVAKMNGNIQVESQPGVGSTFTVHWPVKVLEKKGVPV